MKTNNLVACPECDALQREVALAPGGSAACVRCGAGLFRNKPHSLDRTLALLSAAAIVFLCANTFPLMELDAQGIRTSTTLFGTVVALQQTGWGVIAFVVLMTTIVVPLLQLGASLYILVPLRLGILPPGLRLAVRTLDAVWEWGMVEVFLLGAMVSMVKLTQIATVHPGFALYMIAGYMLLISAAEAAFEVRALWERVAQLQR
jgi:paraquat-inducible protein A